MKPENLTQKIAEKLAQWQQSQTGQTSGYDYKKSFTELWQQLGQEVFQSSLGDEEYDRNRKKVKTRWGEIVVEKQHPLAQCPNGFRISSHLKR